MADLLTRIGVDQLDPVTLRQGLLCRPERRRRRTVQLMLGTDGVRDPKLKRHVKALSCGSRPTSTAALTARHGDRHRLAGLHERRHLFLGDA